MKITNLPGEIWKWVIVWDKCKRISYRGYYRVSNWGRIKTVSRLCLVRSGGFRQSETKLRAVDKNQGVSLKINGRSRRCRIYRLVLFAFVGKCPKGMEACHKDDDRTNNHIDNLYWGTGKQNMEDARRNGKLKLGEDNHLAKLTNKDVEYIIKECKKDKKGTRKRLCKELGIDGSRITLIMQGKIWRSVSGL